LERETKGMRGREKERDGRQRKEGTQGGVKGEGRKWRR
jgi:hypothetical protein